MKKPPVESPVSNTHVLESWKEIASYLNRSEKTCRRWEQELKLPIHRLEDGPRARVFAYKYEIDSWFSQTLNFDAKNTHNIACEYVSEEDLESLIKRENMLTVGTAISIAKQICAELSEAYKLGIIHHDLTPSKIMFDKSGNVRIMDFGVAQSMKAKEKFGTWEMICTPEYMSPEQAEAKETDQRSDIYSLGVILYEMVTGRVPFEGDTALSILMKHNNEAPKAPKEYNAQVPDDMSKLILKCLEKDKDNRYQSAGEIHSELEKIEKGMPATELAVGAEKPMTSKEGAVIFKKNWFWALVLFAAVILIGIGIHLLRREKPETLIKEKKMLVVLPFENLGFPEDEYFADGITEEITSRLAALHELGVISRSSAFRYKKTDKTIREIGEELGVDFVLEGTVRWERSPDNRGKVRVTPLLIRVADDTYLWSDRYDRKIEDIFAVQSDISEQVIRQIDATLLKSFQISQKAQPTRNLEAYDFYLRGLKSLSASSLEREFKDSIKMLEQAVVLDPGFALAYASLSEYHSLMYHEGYDRTEDRKKKAIHSAMKALEHDPSLAEAHLALGQYYYLCYKDYDKALEEISIAESILPNDERVLSYVGWILRRQGRFGESLDKQRNALQLNPLNNALIENIAYSHMCLRNYKEADDYYRRSILLAPNQQLSYQELAFNNLLWKGSTIEAKKIIEKMPKDENPESFWYWIELDLLERNYQKALDRLASTSVKTVLFQNTYQPIEQYIGQIYYLINEPKLSNINYNLARVLLEEKIREHPEDARIHSSLGIVNAMLGRDEDALREGILGVYLYPISKDAVMGPSRVEDLAHIYAILGMYDEAIDQIEYLLSIPWLLSVPMLKLHPKWDLLREHPRFKQILEEYLEHKK